VSAFENSVELGERRGLVELFKAPNLENPA